VASNGELAVVKTMLKDKAVDIETVTGSGKTTPILAIEAGKEEVVKLLFEHGAIFDVFSPFHLLKHMVCCEVLRSKS
jgi:hypothetical protein